MSRIDLKYKVILKSIFKQSLNFKYLNYKSNWMTTKQNRQKKTYLLLPDLSNHIIKQKVKQAQISSQYSSLSNHKQQLQSYVPIKQKKSIWQNYPKEQKLNQDLINQKITVSKYIELNSSKNTKRQLTKKSGTVTPNQSVTYLECQMGSQNEEIQQLFNEDEFVKKQMKDLSKRIEQQQSTTLSMLKKGNNINDKSMKISESIILRKKNKFENDSINHNSQSQMIDYQKQNKMLNNRIQKSGKNDQKNKSCINRNLNKTGIQKSNKKNPVNLTKKKMSYNNSSVNNSFKNINNTCSNIPRTNGRKSVNYTQLNQGNNIQISDFQKLNTMNNEIQCKQQMLNKVKKMISLQTMRYDENKFSKFLKTLDDDDKFQKALKIFVYSYFVENYEQNSSNHYYH